MRSMSSHHTKTNNVKNSQLLNLTVIEAQSRVSVAWIKSLPLFQRQMVVGTVEEESLTPL